MSIEVLRPGLLTTLQDIGRFGYQKYGVIVSGAMDSYSLRVANLLVGNAAGEAALEITLLGPTLKFRQAALVAVTGGDLSPTVNCKPVPQWRPVYLEKDSVLKFGACRAGCRAYLAIAGGYAVTQVMASKSTYLRAGLGGFQGRQLAAGDVLALNAPGQAAAKFSQNLVKAGSRQSFAAPLWYAGREPLAVGAEELTVRVMRGSQYEHFAADSTAVFWNSMFQVTPQSDRMGYRLTGPVLRLKQPLELVSEAVALGTIQVPPDGNPIILLADRQTTGGYPKLGQVAQVDIPKIAQLKPGGRIRFREITVEEAEKLYLAQENNLNQLAAAIGLKLTSQ